MSEWDFDGNIVNGTKGRRARLVQEWLCLHGFAVSVAPGSLSPGSLFLSRRTSLDWVHTGIVLNASGDSFDTIEGNTNDSGSREGFEVLGRTRGYAGKDFVALH